MLKREPGYAPDAGDWFWLKASPSGNISREGKDDGCINCHRQRDSDFMLSWNYGREPFRHGDPTHKPQDPRPKLLSSP